MLEQRLGAIEHEVAHFGRLFEAFRGYANQQFSGLYARLDSIEENMVTKSDLHHAFSEFEVKFDEKMESRFADFEERIVTAIISRLGRTEVM